LGRPRLIDSSAVQAKRLHDFAFSQWWSLARFMQETDRSVSYP
jgi:uncharacterized membrane protein YhaH (DUF805 family)